MKIILFQLALLLSTHQWLYAQAKEAALRGKLLDEETLTPIANATIELLNFSPSRKATTSVDGLFEIVGLPLGKHRLLVSADKYDGVEIGVELKRDKYVELPIKQAVVEPEEETIKDRATTKVSTASNTFEQLIDAPATIYVITNQDITDRGYTSLADVLEDIPEIELQERVDLNTYNNYTVRGISGNEKFLILMDGVRMNSAANSASPIDKNYSIRYAKRIEILLGPASAVYGADAFLGVINIITEKGKHLRGVSASSGYGSYNTSDNQFQIGFGNYKNSVSMRGSFYNSNEPNYSKFYPDAYQWYNQHFLPYGSVRNSPFTNNNDTFLLGSESYYSPRQAYSFDVRFDLKNFTIGISRQNEWYSSAIADSSQFGPPIKKAITSSSLNNIYLGHTLAAQNSNRWVLTSTLHWNHYTLDPVSKLKNVYSNYADAYKYGFNSNIRLLENFTYNINENNRALAGLTFQHTTALPKTGDLPTQFNMFSSAAAQNFYYLGTNILDKDGYPMNIPQNFYAYTQINIGGFLQYQTSIKNRLLITVGSRFDYNVRQDKAKLYAQQQYFTVNPRVGLVYKVNESLRLKLFYGEAFLAPSPEKLFEQFGSFIPVQDSAGNNDHFASNFFHLPSPNLKPEKMRSAELQLNYLQTNYSLQLGGYFNYASDLVSKTSFQNEIFKNVEVLDVERNINNNKAITYGGTARVEYRITYGVANKDLFKLYASYTYSDGQIADSLELFFNAKHTVKAGVFASFKNFSVDVRSIIRSASFNNNTLGQQQNNPYVLLNIYAKYRLLLGKNSQTQVDFFVRVRNALNSLYYNPTPYSTAHLTMAPQAPIAILGGIAISFHKPNQTLIVQSPR